MTVGHVSKGTAWASGLLSNVGDVVGAATVVRLRSGGGGGILVSGVATGLNDAESHT